MSEKWIMVDRNAYDDAVEQVITEQAKVTKDMLGDTEARDLIMRLNILTMAMVRRILFEEEQNNTKKSRRTTL